MAEKIPESGRADPGADGGKELPQRRVELELPLLFEGERQRRHPRFGERGGVEAGAGLEAFAADAIAGDVAPADLRWWGHQHFDRAHRAAEAGETVEILGERRRVRLTVGHGNRILP